MVAREQADIRGMERREARRQFDDDAPGRQLHVQSVGRVERALVGRLRRLDDIGDGGAGR